MLLRPIVAPHGFGALADAPLLGGGAEVGKLRRCPLETLPRRDGITGFTPAIAPSLGDLLITSTGEGTIGRVDVYPYGDAAFADGHVTICRIQDGPVTPEYVLEYLRSEYGQVQMLRYVSGSTGQTELLIGHVKELIIPVPSPETQDHIVGVMESARSESRRLALEADEMGRQASHVIAEARQAMIGKIASPAEDDQTATRREERADER